MGDGKNKQNTILFVVLLSAVYLLGYLAIYVQEQTLRDSTDKSSGHNQYEDSEVRNDPLEVDSQDVRKKKVYFVGVISAEMMRLGSKYSLNQHFRLLHDILDKDEDIDWEFHFDYESAIGNFSQSARLENDRAGLEDFVRDWQTIYQAFTIRCYNKDVGVYYPPRTALQRQGIQPNDPAWLPCIKCPKCEEEDRLETAYAGKRILEIVLEK